MEITGTVGDFMLLVTMAMCTCVWSTTYGSLDVVEGQSITVYASEVLRCQHKLYFIKVIRNLELQLHNVTH